MSFSSQQISSLIFNSREGARVDTLIFTSADGAIVWTVPKSHPFFKTFHKLPPAKRDIVRWAVSSALSDVSTELSDSLGSCPDSIFSALAAVRHSLSSCVKQLAANVPEKLPRLTRFLLR